MRDIGCMKIYGIDFTSRPKRRKPITCLACDLEGDRLTAGSLLEWPTFEGFEAALGLPGPWIAGVDSPFGQARKFIETIGWPMTWQDYVDHVSTMSRAEFRKALDDYRAKRPPGDKEHRRLTDIAAGSISPQKLYGTPVGLMFYEAAPRLRKANVTIPRMQDGDPNRIVVEAYPGVLARHFIGRRSYKQDTKKKQTKNQHIARRDLHNILSSGQLRATYGLTLDAPQTLADDPTGDQLDALLCAIQAAWAWRNKDQNYGAADPIDPLEGWIADATLHRGQDSGANRTGQP